MCLAYKGLVEFWIIVVAMVSSMRIILLAFVLVHCAFAGNVGELAINQPNLDTDKAHANAPEYVIPGSTNNETECGFQPIPGQGYQIFNETRRKLGSFQLCALCTCCGGPKRLCLPSPCCYTINCNIPNRPFGFCSFTPITCNCLGCHL